jgi:hypothetical protein
MHAAHEPGTEKGDPDLFHMSAELSIATAPNLVRRLDFALDQAACAL